MQCITYRHNDFVITAKNLKWNRTLCLHYNNRPPFPRHNSWFHYRWLILHIHTQFRDTIDTIKYSFTQNNLPLPNLYIFSFYPDHNYTFLYHQILIRTEMHCWGILRKYVVLVATTTPPNRGWELCSLFIITMIAILIILVIMLLETSHYACRQSPKVTSTTFTTIKILVHMPNLNPDMDTVDMWITDL